MHSRCNPPLPCLRPSGQGPEEIVSLRRRTTPRFCAGEGFESRAAGHRGRPPGPGPHFAESPEEFVGGDGGKFVPAGGRALVAGGRFVAATFARSDAATVLAGGSAGVAGGVAAGVSATAATGGATGGAAGGSTAAGAGVAAVSFASFVTAGTLDWLCPIMGSFSLQPARIVRAANAATLYLSFIYAYLLLGSRYIAGSAVIPARIVPRISGANGAPSDHPTTRSLLPGGPLRSAIVGPSRRLWSPGVKCRPAPAMSAMSAAS